MSAKQDRILVALELLAIAFEETVVTLRISHPMALGILFTFCMKLHKQAGFTEKELARAMAEDFKAN